MNSIQQDCWGNKYCYWFFITIGLMAPQLSAVSCFGYDFSNHKNKQLMEMVRTIPYIPGILSGNSTQTRRIVLTSLLNIAANSTKLIQELLHRPQTAVWYQLVANFPIIVASCVNLTFDVSRLMQASLIAEKNKLLLQKDFVVHQGFCLIMELFLRGCAWSAELSDKGPDKAVAERLALAANIVEQWRLNTRWFRLQSGISQQHIRKLVTTIFGREFLCQQ